MGPFPVWPPLFVVVLNLVFKIQFNPGKTG